MRYIARNLSVLGLYTVLACLTMGISTSLGATIRYHEQADSTRSLYVVSYDDALTVTIGLTAPVAVLSGSFLAVNSGTESTLSITLSSGNGCVFAMDRRINYESDDRLITMRGRYRFTDTEFYVYNPIPASIDSPALGDIGSAIGARLIITAADDAIVTITDLTDGTDNETGISIAGRTAFVKALSNVGMLLITSDTPVSVQLGLLDDSHAALAPTKEGALVGFDATVTTTGNIGVMPLGSGDIEISRPIDTSGLNSQILFSGPVTAGSAIFIEGVIHGDLNPGEYQGVVTLHVTGDTPFYTWVGRGRGEDAFFIPPDPDPALTPYTHYFLSSPHSRQSSQVVVTAYEAANITLKDLAGNVISPSAGTSPLSDGGHLVFSIPAAGDDDFDNLLDAGYELTSTGKVTVLSNQPLGDARGYVILSPDEELAIPPQIADFNVTSTTQHNFDGSTSEWLTISIDARDFNADLTSWKVTDPNGLVIVETGYAAGIDDGTTLQIGPAVFPVASTVPGEYTLTITDAAGLVGSSTDNIRNLILDPPEPLRPLDGAKRVPVSPFFEWSEDITYVDNAIEVSTDSTFSIENLKVLDFSQTQSFTFNLALGWVTQDTLVGLTDYFWRIRGRGRDPVAGIDRVVISRPFAFTTALSSDLVPPTIILGPQVVSIDTSKAVISWQTDELSTGVVAYASPDFEQGVRSVVKD